MAGNVLTSESFVHCGHQGKVTPQQLAARVQIAGNPAVLATAGTVAVCTLPQPPNGLNDKTVVWTTGTTRVTAGGVALALDSAPAQSLPSGSLTMVVSVQRRVTAT